ncbi:MAG: putative DNA-binding domain-containing protein [Gammaproteobacteria bacterium]|nr:putative DNA-binding domain-containing protein [Gammaproteobacteria bacterium]
MPSLLELQRDFLAVMLRRSDPATLGRHLQQRGDLARRIGVYRTNTLENFATALGAAFPVLRAWLGPEDFRAMAWSYQRRHPSQSGNLFNIGRALPPFLAGALAGTPEEWLADLARLEWLVQEAMVAADDTACFDPRALAGVAPMHHGELRFRLHPSVRLATLAHPCFAAWEAHQAGKPPQAPAQAGTEQLLVRRAGEGIELLRLDAGSHACLDALAAGEPLARVVAALEDIAPGSDPGACLAGWATAGVIIGVEPV